MRLGAAADLRRVRLQISSKPRSSTRQHRVAPVRASARQERARKAVLPVVAAVLGSAGQAVAATVVPEGSGVPVAGGAAAAPGTISVDSAVDQLVNAIRAAGGVVQQGLDVAGAGAQKAKEALDVASPYVKSAADTVAPYAKTAADVLKDAAGPALRSAQPTLQSSLSDAQKLLQQQGLDTAAVQGASQQATSQASGLFAQAKPILSEAVHFVQTTPPGLLAEYAFGALGVYLLGPKVLGLAFGGLRGYAGDVSAPAALDLVSTRGNTFIVDLRSEREKENGGALDIPGNGRLIELEYAEVGDRKLRSQLRNVSGLELQVTAMEVAALKKIGKGSTLLLLDRNGGQSRAVAKQLRQKGFKRAFVVSGGFGGWTGAKLRVKPSSSVSRVEVLPALGTITRRASGNSTTTNRRALPSGR